MAKRSKSSGKTSASTKGKGRRSRTGVKTRRAKSGSAARATRAARPSTAGSSKRHAGSAARSPKRKTGSTVGLYGKQIMNVVVAPGSRAEKKCFAYAGISKPAGTKVKAEALAGGLPPTPGEDLIYRGGKTLPDLTFTNFYLGASGAWSASDRNSIDAALSAAMKDRKLNNVLAQYFPGGNVSSAFRPSNVLAGPPPKTVTRGDIDLIVKKLDADGLLNRFDLDTTIFALLCPRGTILSDDDAPSQAKRRGKAREDGDEKHEPLVAEEEADSLHGLGGYHGSVRFGSRRIYFAISVFSDSLDDGSENGIVAFDQPWKNVVATLYHELCEARTDPDVEDANRAGNIKVLGWTSKHRQEIGDFPISEAENDLSLVFKEVPLADGSGKVPIQLQYSNAVHGPEGPIDQPHQSA